MTVAEAISLADNLKPNQYPQTVKIKWLSKLDGQIFIELFKTHEGCPMETFEGYDINSMDTELLIPFPYAEDVYLYYLQSQMDKENGEIAKYNQTSALYNNAYRNFQNWYNRTHTPIPTGTRFLF